MNLKTKSIVLVALCFLTIFAAFYGLTRLVGRDLRAGLATMYVKEQVRYNRERILHPVMSELVLARKLADSPAIRRWAGAEDDPACRAAAFDELEGYRRFFADRSYFFAIRESGNYYYNDRDNRYAGAEYRYTLKPAEEDDLWFFRTLEGGRDYALNVDYDEKLKVTKVWLNVVVRDEEQAVGVIGTGIDLSDFIAAVVASDHAGVRNIFVEESGAIQADRKIQQIDFRTISKEAAARKTIFQLLDSPREAERLREMLSHLAAADSKETGVLAVTLEGREVLLGIGAIREIGWFNITMVDTAAVIGSLYIVPFSLLQFAALLLLSLALTALLNRFVIQRIHRLDRLVQDFGRGEEVCFSEEHPADEVGRLEGSFSQMALTIREHERTLEEKVAARTAELEEKNRQLQQALSEINVLSGLLPICMYCKGIRDDKGAWTRLEEYLIAHSDAEVSHGVCDACLQERHPEKYAKLMRNRKPMAEEAAQ